MEQRGNEEMETAFVVGYESPNDPMKPHKWAYGSEIFATTIIDAKIFVGLLDLHRSLILRP
jgi:hypothetical protein